LILGSNRFWDSVDLALKLFSLLVKILRRVDSDKPFMRFLYDDLERAKEEIYNKKNSTQKKRNIFLYGISLTKDEKISLRGLYIEQNIT